MDLRGVLRGPWVVVLLLFSFVPSEGQAPPSTENLVLFPPGRPSKDNLPGICNNGLHRPPYRLDSLPTPGYSYLRRQATAVNNLEELYRGCCRSYGTQDDALTLKCAQGAWETALSEFCEEEYSVKTRFYHCCQNDVDFGCFEKWAPNPSYQHPVPQKQT
ncbi:extracellular matrix protein 1 isoform X2 [Anguilla rostrata]|uniref:extracellular matrix protein 1 isoform X1 n=1 Tax=Anguilla rostrata TaxID=7938 RepID=UPI0030D521DB